MTLVVVTAHADTPDALYESARRAAAHADWVEVRLDGPSGLPWDLRAFFSVDKPCIATMRHADEGGQTHADDATRADVLRRAIKAGARAIDVEITSDARDALLKEAKDAGVRVILSRHDLDGTPSAQHIVEELREMRALGADWCKLATRVESPADAAALVEAAQLAHAERIPYALMAVNDPFLRLLAPSLGMALVYAAAPGQPPAAPGQVAADLMRAAHARARSEASRFTGATRGAFLLGHPVVHSRSPAMQNAAFAAAGVNACYLALDVAEDALGATVDALARAGALGMQFTVPHKVAALALCTELDEAAREAGAVNTLVLREDGARVGHNTDGDGALDALREAGARVRDQDVLLLGAGGAARGLAFALKREGARVIVTNRSLEKAKALADAAGALWLPWEDREKALARVGLVVNATTLGMHDAGESPVDPARLASPVLDAVYRRGGTRLVREARARGLVAVPGEAMLLHQGMRAFRLWTGQDAPVHAMQAALREEPS